jgi:hypothetical protein
MEFKKSAFTPVLLRIDKFDQEKPQRSELLRAPKELRWERWVTVMSYDDSTKVWVFRVWTTARTFTERARLEYATSFHGAEEKLSQWIHIDDLPITDIVTLREEISFGGDRAGDIRTSTQAPTVMSTNAPKETQS